MAILFYTIHKQGYFARRTLLSSEEIIQLLGLDFMCIDN